MSIGMKLGILGASGTSDGIITDGLILHLDAADTNSYPGSGTTWTDLSGNGNHGTLENAPTFSSDNGGSIAFDGSNDYVDLGNDASLRPAIADGFTVSCWIKSSSDITLINIFSNDGAENNYYGVWVTIGGSSKMTHATGDGGGPASYSRSTHVASTLLSTNTWYHFTYLFDGENQANWDAYLNGSIESTGTTSGTGGNMSYTGGEAYIGRRYGDYGEFTMGSFQFYDRLLSADEITQNYNAQKERYE